MSADSVYDDVTYVYDYVTGEIDMGADVSRLSQYPAENEVLFPPLSNIEVCICVYICIYVYIHLYFVLCYMLYLIYICYI